jgi:hypothetical protein
MTTLFVFEVMIRTLGRFRRFAHPAARGSLSISEATDFRGRSSESTDPPVGKARVQKLRGENSSRFGLFLAELLRTSQRIFRKLNKKLEFQERCGLKP